VVTLCEHTHQAREGFHDNQHIFARCYYGGNGAQHSYSYDIEKHATRRGRTVAALKELRRLSEVKG